jgi:opacity protein-like surface antigen
MRKVAMVTAVAVSAILATPAAARDGAPYVGVDGGVMLVEDSKFDYSDVNNNNDEAIVVDYKRGLDVGIFTGYDFGAFRLEAEGAYKRAGVQEIYIDPSAGIVPTGTAGVNEASGRVRVTSGMVNALLDFGNEGVTGFAGVGLGVARVQLRGNTVTGGNGFSGSDTPLAWQGLAGVRFPLSANLDAGLKYRFFSTRRLNFDVDNAVVPFELRSRFRSHSLLASIAYNFAPPPPPPVIEAPVAPPPPPPATQTCPDGSVILATDVCPQPPAPPPPPPPTEERG